MFSLTLLLLLSLASDNSGQEENIIESLGDRIKSHLDADPTTKNILAEIYNRPMTDQLKGSYIFP